MLDPENIYSGNMDIEAMIELVAEHYGPTRVDFSVLGGWVFGVSLQIEDSIIMVQNYERMQSLPDAIRSVLEMANDLYTLIPPEAYH